MTTNTAMIFVGSVMVITCGVTVYTYFRNKALEDVRKDVYQLFLYAEKRFTESGHGKQKMDMVIRMTRDLLPAWAKFFITEDLLRRVVQKWFDAVKDLLDDGKYNRSIE